MSKELETLLRVDIDKCEQQELWFRDELINTNYQDTLRIKKFDYPEHLMVVFVIYWDLELNSNYDLCDHYFNHNKFEKLRGAVEHKGFPITTTSIFGI